MPHHPNRSRSDASYALARGLGWFSIGLGLTEVLASPRMARTLGMHGQENIIRACGWREIATGIGVLAAKDPAPWIRIRLGGDILDIAMLAGSFHEDNRRRRNVGLAMTAIAGLTVLDAYCARALSSEQERDRSIRDYSDRSGLPRSPKEMRGAASDFMTPPDMRSAWPISPHEPDRSALIHGSGI